jgi:tRNA pseudouridine38-40 synthase
MATQKFYYLVHFQYLGFRYHGWQKQPGLLTVEHMIEKTLRWILGSEKFKILAASRTDARVSANHSAFELFLERPIPPETLLADLNLNLPPDIRILQVEETDRQFSILNAPRTKEYTYLFSFGEKCHPFAAALVSAFPEHLDIGLMQQGARLFQGRHNFIQYCTQPKPGTMVEREIIESRIEENVFYQASFFPEKTWVYIVRARGFLRYQVRLIMGQLRCLGRGEISLQDIQKSLTGADRSPLRHIAPASGLILNAIEFE